MQVITEDHYVPAVFYGRGAHTLTRDEIGTAMSWRPFAFWSIPTTTPISTKCLCSFIGHSDIRTVTMGLERSRRRHQGRPEPRWRAWSRC